MVFIDAVAGCEYYNKYYFIRKGGARTGAYSGEISRVCISLLDNEQKLWRMHESLATMPKENAAGIIYRRMHELTEEKFRHLNDGKKPNKTYSEDKRTA